MARRSAQAGGSVDKRLALELALFLFLDLSLFFLQSGFFLFNGSGEFVLLQKVREDHLRFFFFFFFFL